MLRVLPPELAVIAEGSLLDKVFSVKKDYLAVLTRDLCKWTKDSGLPSMPKSQIADLVQLLWQQRSQPFKNHITKTTVAALESTFDGAIFHCEASSLRIFCPCLYFQAIETTFTDTSVCETILHEPQDLVTDLVSTLQRGHVLPMGHWKGSSTPFRLHLGKEEGLPKWTTYHLLSFPLSALHFDRCSTSLHG